MDPRRWNRLATLHKVEATYGTDAAPVAANALLLSNVTFTPMEATEIQRGRMLPYMGNQGIVLSGRYGRMEADIEAAGAGVAGTVPKYGSVLRAAGLAETVTAGTSVEYTIVEDAQESSSLYFIYDGTRHILAGCRANVSVSFTPLELPHFRVTWVGLLGAIMDAGAMPAVTAAGWVDPVPVEKANTVMSLHGWPSIAESLSMDLGNTLTPRFLIGDERVLITDRSSTGTAVVEAHSLATIDWFDRAKKRTRGALSIVHGTDDGNIVEITAPAVEVGRPTINQRDNIANYSLPLGLCPVSGRDEFKITIR